MLVKFRSAWLKQALDSGTTQRMKIAYSLQKFVTLKWTLVCYYLSLAHDKFLVILWIANK